MSGNRRVHVGTESGTYDVVVGRGVLGEAGDLVRAVARGRRVALVSDSNVSELLGAQVGAKLITAGLDVRPLTFAAGEASKSWQTAGELLEALAEAGLDRLDTVVALGGGVVGDLVGFSAATYLRGVDFVQMPTTLLAQVDSSVGGKTGVDLRAGKNLAGAFKQPLLVLADVDTLASLPEAEWRSGLAEVAKSAIIDSEEFTAWIEANASALLQRDPAAVEEAVVRCVAFKSGVVSTDEKEEGVRECLNYGHTLGHAIENVAGYGVIPHGLAVAEGMRFAARLAVEVSGASREFVKRQDAMLDSLGLEGLSSAWSVGKLALAMQSDKKARSGTVRFVLADKPGSWACTSVEDRTIREHLDAWAGSKGSD
jgi:3-dehydroquinate synthase